MAEALAAPFVPLPRCRHNALSECAVPPGPPHNGLILGTRACTWRGRHSQTLCRTSITHRAFDLHVLILAAATAGRPGQMTPPSRGAPGPGQAAPRQETRGRPGQSQSWYYPALLTCPVHLHLPLGYFREHLPEDNSSFRHGSPGTKTSAPALSRIFL